MDWQEGVRSVWTTLLQCEHQHPPWWCWSQLVCPGRGWVVWDGDSSSSTTGGLVLSWPTGGGHGRSLITLISTAFVCPPTTPASQEMEGGGGKRKVDAVARWRWAEAESKKRKQKRESEWNTATKNARILTQSRLTMWSQNQQQLWARKGEECSRTGKRSEIRQPKSRVGFW